MTKVEITCQRLEEEGWEYDHAATYNGYESSGDVTRMRSKGYYEYCRVHLGRTVRSKRNWQITYVYRRLRKELRGGSNNG